MFAWRGVVGNQNVAGVDVFVNHLLSVNAAQNPGHIHRNPQFLGQVK